MGKTPKIEMRNLYWAYGIKTGTIPYIFNNDKTAIKLYSKYFDFDIIQLKAEQSACEALGEYFQESFLPLSRIKVYEQSFSTFEQELKRILHGSYDFQPFSHKDVDNMMKSYNKYMYNEHQRKIEQEKYQKARQTEQDAIMDF